MARYSTDPRITRMLEAQKVWQKDQPRRCATNLVGTAGECLACDAEQGEHCRRPALEAEDGR